MCTRAWRAVLRPVKQKIWLSSGGLVCPWAGSWRDNVGSWLSQKELPLLLVRYERLKANPAEELRRIMRFLGRQSNEERIAVAVEAGKPDNMRKLESEEVKAGVSGVFYRQRLRPGLSLCWAHA
jgi:hypothetical protein